MNIRLGREQQRAALTLLRELMSVEEQGMLKQVEEHLDSIGLTLPEVQILFTTCCSNIWGKNEEGCSKGTKKRNLFSGLSTHFLPSAHPVADSSGKPTLYILGISHPLNPRIII